jgi:flagellar basal-body rod protein FlgF
VVDSPVVQKHWTDFAQGTLLQTGNATDLALSGSGFFSVNGPNGPLYTRSGNFHLSPQGVLVSEQGYPVRLVQEQVLQTQSTQGLEVQPDGQILQDGNVLGQLELVDFADPSVLAKAAGTYFRNPDPQTITPTASSAQVYQGKTESSNATPAEAAARMVTLMRHFEMLQHAIKIGTEMNREAVEEVARVGS